MQATNLPSNHFLGGLSMELLLAPDWSQVAPRKTPYTLLMSGQSPGQNLVAFDTAFENKRVVAFSGGANCPLAIDHKNDRVYFSCNGVHSVDLRSGAERHFDIGGDLAPIWLLELDQYEPSLLMHLHSIDPRRKDIGRLSLETGLVERSELPTEAFYPMDVDLEGQRILYTTRRGGAAVLDVSGAIRTISELALPYHAIGGCFDLGGSRVLLGGKGLLGWDIATSQTVRLTEEGTDPALDESGAVWFSLSDGVLARLRPSSPSPEIIVQLSGLDTSDHSYAQPVVFSPDGRYGLARLTGRTPLTGYDLTQAEEFYRRTEQKMGDFERHSYHHYLCILDLQDQEVWCHEGYAHNLAWIAGDHSGATRSTA
jgi:hypothetical protein